MENINNDLKTILERIAEKIKENTNPDGTYEFNDVQVRGMLLMTEDILNKSIQGIID